MRQIFLDTETTGFDKNAEVVEIGCIEAFNKEIKNLTWQQYIKPVNSMPIEAYNVHGLDDAFLADKPSFITIVDDFIAYVEGARLIMHNAEFDTKMLNRELVRCNEKLSQARYGTLQDYSESIVDSLEVARQKFPSQSNSLDSLVKRFNLQFVDRTYHGALKDAKLLAQVYFSMVGGEQGVMQFPQKNNFTDTHFFDSPHKKAPVIAATREDIEQHENFFNINKI